MAEKKQGIRLDTKNELPRGTDLLSPKDPKLGVRYTGAAGATIIKNPYTID